jgi:AcrR family transcriptional regulator
VARKSRTRNLVLEALIDLIDAGDPKPTPRAVAERAEVAVRTMYNHFRLDELFVAAADRQVSRYGPLITIVPPSGPLGTRVTLIIRQRRHLFETVGPVLRASYARIPTSPELSEVLDRQRALLRLQLARTLGPEIQSHTTSARVVLSTLEALAGWQAWSTLRFACAHSARQAEQFMVFTISQVLGGVNPPRTRGSG